ncbi:multiple epidermal growth factor-like domains protein 6 [Neocloeon triangulifer]|uniref:multiple epidermal growth factor-like domains protein 6 n=1 Tax=Neocloeon triangulifer TaxID=2078957 RepID=UPI00286EF83B|nr:multiple epidermal growth factor-like domains protein 6 [Neocloeon triangulifer]
MLGTSLIFLSICLPAIFAQGNIPYGPPSNTQLGQAPQVIPSAPCQPGFYGPNCAQRMPGNRYCGGQFREYNQMTGLCIYGCQWAGQQPPYCDRECYDGKFGFNCNFDQPRGKCSGLGQFGTYNKVDGKCTVGCARPGYLPPDCVTVRVCEYGKYGINCNEQFYERVCNGNGHFGEYDFTNGACTKGCVHPGKQAPFCKYDCGNGKFGWNCQHDIPKGRCAGPFPYGNYDKVSGHCYSCKSHGKKLPNCTYDCDEGEFGQNCQLRLPIGEKRCSGYGMYGDYDKKTGNCKHCAQPGFKLPSCNQMCDDGTFGLNCKLKLKLKKCSGHMRFGEYDPATGNCRGNCLEPGLKYPECDQACENGWYGAHCQSKLGPGTCGGQEIGNYDKKTGHCRTCGRFGFKPPLCTEPCEAGFFGLHCLNNVKHKCSGNDTSATGHCTTSCQYPGFEFPWCENECEDGKFGLNCTEKLGEKKCSGAGKYGDYNKATGECLQSCEKFNLQFPLCEKEKCSNNDFNRTNGRCSVSCAAPGFIFPDCGKECDHGAFGLNCLQNITTKKCAGSAPFGDYDPATGNCQGDCFLPGFKKPECDKECDNGTYGLHCASQLGPRICGGQGLGNYDKKTGQCRSCARSGYKLPTCTEPCDVGFFGLDCKRNFTSNKKCSDDDYDRVTGYCNTSCQIPGFEFPACDLECEEGEYGLNCKEQLNKKKCSGPGDFGYYNKSNGECLNSCEKLGLQFPLCEKACDDGFYGLNCQGKISNKCSNNAYDLITGYCNTTCRNSEFQFPGCERACEEGEFGPYCEHQHREKKCSGGGDFGEYNKANGECVQSCEDAGVQFPLCEKECQAGKFGLNCNESLPSGVCEGKTEFGDYDKATGDCKSGCKVNGMQPPKCIIEIKNK